MIGQLTAALADELAAVAEQLSASVVQVRAGRGGIGSGVIWQVRPAQAGGDPEALIITNEHVVRAVGTSKLALLVHDGRTVEAETIGHDPEHDLALLRSRAAGLRAVEAGDSSALRVGELVIAVGNPFGKINALTAGIVAARAPADPDILLEPLEPATPPEKDAPPREHHAPADGRRPEGPRERASHTPDLIQADIALYPGNSGGPLADARGRVVGINSMVGGGLAFAIPSRIVQQFIALVDSPSAAQPRLGVEVLGVDLPAAMRARAGLRAETAVLVTGIDPDGPAAAAGVLVGDLLIGVDGQAITTPRELLVALRLGDPSAGRVLTLLRGGIRRDLAVQPQAQPGQAAA